MEIEETLKELNAESRGLSQEEEENGLIQVSMERKPTPRVESSARKTQVLNHRQKS